MRQYLVVPLAAVALLSAACVLPELGAQDPPPSPPPVAPPPAPPAGFASNVPMLQSVAPSPAMVVPLAVSVPARLPEPELAPTDPHAMELCGRYNGLEQQVLQLAAQYRQSPPNSEERTKLQQQLTELTREQFQVRQDFLQLEVERLQQRLKELEFKLQRRQERRDDIVTQRVAQLTDGDDELRWEPLMPPGAPVADPNAYGSDHAVFHGRAVPPGGQQLFGPARPLSTVPAPPVPPALPHPPSPFGPPSSMVPPPIKPDAVPPTAAKPELPRVPGVPAVPAVPDESARGPSPPAPSVAEAQARCEIAQRELDRVKQLFERGVAPVGELERAEDAVRLSRIVLQNAQREHKLRIKMMELDVGRAESELARLQAELAETETLVGQNKNSASEARLRKAMAAVAQKRYDVERARAILESERSQDGPGADNAENDPGR